MVLCIGVMLDCWERDGCNWEGREGRRLLVSELGEGMSFLAGVTSVLELFVGIYIASVGRRL